MTDQDRAIAACLNDAEGRKGVAGTVKCPVCGNLLRYTIPQTEGHIWFSCESQDCVRFMQ